MTCPSILLSGGWLPGKVGTKFIATPAMADGPAISGMYAGALGLRRGGGWCGEISKKKKKDTVDSDWRSQGSWRFLGMSLELASKKRPAKAVLGYLASARSVWSPWTGGYGEWKDPPPETGFQKGSPFLHLDLEKAPGQLELGGWGGRVGPKER